MLEKLNSINDDLAELVSRGTNHPQGDEIVGRMRVTLSQAMDETDLAPPPADPVTVRLDRLADGVNALMKHAGISTDPAP